VFMSTRSSTLTGYGLAVLNGGWWRLGTAGDNSIQLVCLGTAGWQQCECTRSSMLTT
jgi:hypothetical protein